MKRCMKKIDHEDCIDAMRYLYLSNRYYNLLDLHKNNDKVSDELKIEWTEGYIKNTIQYNTKAFEVMKDNDIPIGRVGRFEFNLEEDLLDYCLREIDEQC